MNGRIILEIDGRTFEGRVVDFEERPSVVAAPPPPAPPPPPPPDDDGRPFEWPPQPNIPLNDPAIRAAWSAVHRATGQKYYVQSGEFGNQLPHSHRFAGWTPAFSPAGIPPNHRVWAPQDGDPAAIRRVLRGERP